MTYSITVKDFLPPHPRSNPGPATEYLCMNFIMAKVIYMDVEKDIKKLYCFNPTDVSHASCSGCTCF